MSRRRKSAEYAEFWPGYVDMLSTLLMVFMFLLTIFMVAQYHVSREASGKDDALRRLTRRRSPACVPRTLKSKVSRSTATRNRAPRNRVCRAFR